MRGARSSGEKKGLSGPKDFQWRLGVLAGCGALREAGAEELRLFAQSSRHRRYADGELVAARGAAPEGMAVVVRGAIRIASVASDGREVVYSLVQRGMVWGVVAAIDGKGTTHDTRAHGPTEVLMLPRRALMEALDRHPRLYAIFARMLCHRLRKAHGLVDELALAPLRQRLARSLCTLATGEPEGRDGGAVRLSFAQSDIAVMLSASRPAVNRELKRLEEEGLLELHYRGITVKHIARLQGICENREILSY